MSIIGSKWIIALALIVVALAVLYLMGRKSVHAELVISAEPEEIWSVLMDKNNYSTWNPVLIPVKGDFKEGESLTYRMISPGDRETMVETRVVKLQQNKLLNQFGGVPGVLTFDHHWILEPVANGTKVIQHEEYRGIGVLFWNPSWVGPAYLEALKGLKTIVSN